MADRPSKLCLSAGEPRVGPIDRHVSVLFDRDPGGGGQSDTVPDFFIDLNLDQIAAAITARRSEYRLEPLLNLTLTEPDAVIYRHAVMQDLEQEALRTTVARFAKSMHDVRARLAEAGQRRYPKQKQRWFLDAVSLSSSSAASRGVSNACGSASAPISAPTSGMVTAASTISCASRPTGR